MVWNAAMVQDLFILMNNNSLKWVPVFLKSFFASFTTWTAIYGVTYIVWTKALGYNHPRPLDKPFFLRCSFNLHYSLNTENDSFSFVERNGVQKEIEEFSIVLFDLVSRSFRQTLFSDCFQKTWKYRRTVHNCISDSSR